MEDRKTDLNGTVDDLTLGKLILGEAGREATKFLRASIHPILRCESTLMVLTFNKQINKKKGKVGKNGDGLQIYRRTKDARGQ